MILSKVKPLKQKKSMCGPASLEIVLRYYDAGKGQNELKKLLNSSMLNGTTSSNMIRVAKGLGFKARYKTNSSASDIRKLIADKVPPIIGWFTPEGGSHYSVVKGIDKKNIFIVDPNLSKIRKFKIEDFEDRWYDVAWDKMNYFRKLFMGSKIWLWNKFVERGVLPLDKKDIVRGEMIVIERKS